MELYVDMGSGLLFTISKGRDSTVLLEGFSDKDMAVWGKKLLLIVGHWLDISKTWKQCWERHVLRVESLDHCDEEWFSIKGREAPAVYSS